MSGLEPQELRCKACGAALHYEPGAEVITCAHCGTEYVLDGPSEFTVEYMLEEDEGDAAAPEAAEAGAPPYEAEALSWLRQGKKIEAIKAVREYTGMGLRESKEYVEALASREGVALRAGGSGACVFVVAGIILLATIGVAAFLIMMR